MKKDLDLWSSLCHELGIERGFPATGIAQVPASCCTLGHNVLVTADKPRQALSCSREELLVAGQKRGSTQFWRLDPGGVSALYVHDFIASLGSEEIA